MIERAKCQLKFTIDSEPLHIEDVHSDLVVGNPLALEYAHARAERKAFETRLSTIEADNGQLKQQFEHLQNQVHDLQKSVDGFRDLRNRFISNFKRDKLRNITDTDIQRIISGNQCAHSGNCKRDAELYEPPNARRDFDVYVALYGLNPFIVRSISKFFSS